MRIAIILSCLGNGGAERIAGYLSKHLASIHDVYLFLVDTENIVYEYDGQLVDIGKDGGDYHEYNVKLAKIKYDIDVSISFMEYFNHINVRTRGKDTIILSVRSYQRLMQPREYRYEIQNKNLYPLADHIVAISDGVYNEIIETTMVDPDNISTIYNFFDYERVRIMSKADIPKDMEIDRYEFNECKLIISIGRLVEKKDHIRLLKQFEILHKKDEKTKLIIIGSGKLERLLQDMIDTLRLNDSVFILPYMKNPFPILRLADVFVLSSICEGYGNVLLEAMALGIPIISVDCLAGPREILNDNANYRERVDGWKIVKRGILVTNRESDRTGETEYLADAMENVLNNKKLKRQLIKSATKWIENRSNLEILQQWISCIEKAIKKRNNRKSDKSIIPTKKRHYVIYGAGNYAKKIYIELQKREIYIDAFIVSDKKDSEMKLFAQPVYQREFLLDEGKDYEVIMGVANREYVNQICKWFMDNDMHNVIFYGLQKEVMEV